MKIYELFEQTIAPVPPGQGQPSPPTEAPPKTGNTPQTPPPSGTTPAPATTAAAPNPNTPQVGQPMGGTTPAPNPQQTQQLQQASKDTMTDLDKIAAQIVGLKQKQQQMQQQMQQVAP